MEQVHRDLITDNYVDLTINLNPDCAFLARLHQSGVLTQSMLDDIESCSTTSKKRSMILRIIPTRGPEAFENFKKALRGSGQGFLADLLKPKPVEPPREAKRAIQEKDGIITIAIENVSAEKVNEIQMRIPGCYRLEKKPRGRCVIMNNVNFYTLRDRDGAEKDAVNLSELFKKLHFEVEVWENLTLQKAKDKLDNERVNPAHKDADAFIFIGMSHGARGCVFTCDDKRLEIEEDIVKNFNGVNCPALLGKPKIFLFQACRGNALHFGLPQADDPVPEADSITAQVKRLSIQDDTESSRKKLINVAGDVLIAYATVPDYVALLVPDLGSWFMREFVITCMETAHENHILDILTVVAARVDGKKRPGFLQATSTDVRLSKHFYFFPGYFKNQ